MKKSLILIAMMLMGLTSFTQIDSTKSYLEQPKWMSNSPGTELQMATTEYYSGFGLIVFGGFMSTIGSIDGSQAVDKPMLIVGGGVALLGSLLMLDSHKHIRRCGIIMDNRGIGLKIKL